MLFLNLVNINYILLIYIYNTIYKLLHLMSYYKKVVIKYLPILYIIVYELSNITIVLNIPLSLII